MRLLFLLSNEFFYIYLLKLCLIASLGTDLFLNYNLKQLNMTVDLLISRNVVNWRWRRPDDIQESDLPFLFQFDGGDGAETKFQAMKRLGAAFVDLDSDSNNNKCIEKELSNGVLTETRFIYGSKKSEKANFIIKFFHGIFEFVNENIPGIETFILSQLFPYYAYYLVI